MAKTMMMLGFGGALAVASVCTEQVWGLGALAGAIVFAIGLSRLGVNHERGI